MTEVVLKENANLFGKIAILQKVRTIDLGYIIGKYEMMVAVPSLMDTHGECDGDEVKSSLVKIAKGKQNVECGKIAGP